jgi:hypothetical protein
MIEHPDRLAITVDHDGEAHAQDRIGVVDAAGELGRRQHDEFAVFQNAGRCRTGTVIDDRHLPHDLPLPTHGKRQLETVPRHEDLDTATLDQVGHRTGLALVKELDAGRKAEMAR